MMLLLLWCGMSSLLFSETVGCFCYYGMSSLLNGMSTLYYIVQGSCKHVAAVQHMLLFSPTLPSPLLFSPLLCFPNDDIVQSITWHGLWADDQHLWGTWHHPLSSSWWNSPPLLWCHRSSKCMIKVPEYRTTVCLKKQFKLVMMYLLLWISGI